MAKGKIEAKHTEVILVLASKWRKPYKVLILQGKLPSPNLEKVEKAAEFKSCLDFIKETLGDKVVEVCASGDLGDHPVSMVPKGDMSFEMEKYFRSLDPNSDFNLEKVLKINPSHDALIALDAAMKNEPEKAAKYAELLYCQGLLMAGLPLEDLIAYTALVCELMK